MIRTIVFGTPGVGKTSNVVIPTIEAFDGRVIWVTDGEEHDLRLTDCVRELTRITDIATIGEHEKVVVPIINITNTRAWTDHCETIRHAWISKLLETYSHDENTLFVFDNGYFTLHEFLFDVLKDENTNYVAVFDDEKSLFHTVGIDKNDKKACDELLWDIRCRYTWDVLKLNMLNGKFVCCK